MSLQMSKTNQPVIIAVAPNGARKTKNDHPNLPITPTELAYCASACLNEGATMIHLHVRDELSVHSLSPKLYRETVNAVKDRVGNKMMIQVTSESAGIFQADEQISAMMELSPDFISIALREYINDNASTDKFCLFVNYLHNKQCVIQYILYDFEDYKLYLSLISKEQIPKSRHSILIVLGRYTETVPDINIVKHYQSILEHDKGCMVCTFGPNGQQILNASAIFGTHIRVGFENGFLLPNDEIAIDNAHLVKNTIETIKKTGRTIADINYTRQFLS